MEKNKKIVNSKTPITKNKLSLVKSKSKTIVDIEEEFQSIKNILVDSKLSNDRLDYVKSFMKKNATNHVKVLEFIREEFLKDFTKKIGSMSEYDYYTGDFHFTLILALRKIKGLSGIDTSELFKKFDYEAVSIDRAPFSIELKGKVSCDVRSLHKVYNFSEGFTSFSWLSRHADFFTQNDKSFLKQLRDSFYEAIEVMVSPKHTLISILNRVDLSKTSLNGHVCLLDDYVDRLGVSKIGNVIDFKSMNIAERLDLLKKVSSALEVYSSNKEILSSLKDTATRANAPFIDVSPEALPFLTGAYRNLLKSFEGTVEWEKLNFIGRNLQDGDVSLSNAEIETGRMICSFKAGIENEPSVVRMRFYEKCFGKDSLPAVLSFLRTKTEWVD